MTDPNEALEVGGEAPNADEADVSTFFRRAASAAQRSAVSRAESARRRLTPKRLLTVPIDRLAVSIERLRVSGGKREAIQVGRTLVRNAPASGKAHRYLVRSLLTPPVLSVDLREARAIAESMVMLYDDPAVSDQYVSVLIAQHHAQLDEPSIFESAAVFFRSAPERRVGPMRRLLNYLIDSNDVALATHILRDLASDVIGTNPTSLVHEMLLRFELFDDASSLEARIVDEPWAAGELLDLLAAARHIRAGERATGLEMFRQQKPHRTRRYSNALCNELCAQGHYLDVLEYLDSNVHNLTTTEEALLRFDALWILGMEQQATSIIVDEAEASLTNPLVIRRLVSCFGSPAAVCKHFTAQMDELKLTASDRAGDLDAATAAWFELNQIDLILEIADVPRQAERLGTIGTYNLARAFYVRRDFETAHELMGTLTQSIRHWEAAKLQSRMMLEAGQFEEALAHRARYPRAGDPLDEVRFFSMLHLGRFAEAFAHYLDRNDRARLERVFGDAAQLEPIGSAADRFVIAQNGPGDDIQTFSVLPSLAAVSDRLTVTCDHRLLSLLTRSLPDIEFLPVERMGGRGSAGLLRDGHPPRADNEFFDLLTAEAAERAASATSVMLSRSLPILSTRPDAPAPYDPYLVPNPALVSDMAHRFADLQTPTGLVWRSEISGPMRDIHYLRVEAMGPFAELDRDFVCLQHDATEAERTALTELFGPRITFIDDIDLRNDFEAAAATLAACSAVAGVVTTTVELGAAVGTPTILLQPNRFGAWRSQADGQDYWHRSAVNAYSTDHRNAMECVHRAVELLIFDQRFSPEC